MVSVLPSGLGTTGITHGGPSVTEAAWSADGVVVYARRYEQTGAGGKATGHVGVFTLAPGGKPRLIRSCPLNCWASSFAWSPDGRRIAFLTDIRSHFTGYAAEIAVMNADGSGLHVICTETTCGQGLAEPVWSPDGSRLLFSNAGVAGFPGVGLLPSGIRVADANGGGIHKLTQPGCRPGKLPLVGCFFDSGATWSPDGRWISFVRRGSIPIHGHAHPTSIELMAADGSHLHALASCTDVWCALGSPVWSPDGARLAVGPWKDEGAQIVVLTLNGGRQVVRTCSGAHCASPEQIAWAPDGSRLGFISEARDSNAYVIDADGGGMHVIGRHVQCCLAWLPAP